MNEMLQFNQNYMALAINITYLTITRIELSHYLSPVIACQ